VIAWFGAKCVVCGTSAVGTADADTLPSNEKVNPAAPNAGMAALVTRFCFEACFTCGMVASSVSFYVASVRSTGPARKGCFCDKMRSSASSSYSSS
jgi:hypothetical protein